MQATYPAKRQRRRRRTPRPCTPNARRHEPAGGKSSHRRRPSTSTRPTSRRGLCVRDARAVSFLKRFWCVREVPHTQAGRWVVGYRQGEVGVAKSALLLPPWRVWGPGLFLLARFWPRLLQRRPLLRLRWAPCIRPDVVRATFEYRLAPGAERRGHHAHFELPVGGIWTPA